MATQKPRKKPKPRRPQPPTPGMRRPEVTMAPAFIPAPRWPRDYLVEK